MRRRHCELSAQTGEGLEAVREMLRGKCTCLAGQSAVGKSSLLNALFPELKLETGGLSKKTERGRHTTRHSELLYIKEIDAIVTDTPGFSILEVMELEPEELRTISRSFTAYSAGLTAACTIKSRAAK